MGPSLSVKCQIRGMKELARALAKLPKDVDVEAKITMGKALATIQFQAIDNVNQAPPAHPQVQTGTLMGSIMSEVEMEGNSMIGRVGTNLEYAPDLEFGHIIRARTVTYLGVSASGSSGFVPAYPFMGPALRSHEDEIREMFEAALGTAISRSTQ